MKDDWLSGNLDDLQSRSILAAESCRVNEELWDQYDYQIIDDKSGVYQINIANADGRKVQLPEFSTVLGGIEDINDYIIATIKWKPDSFDTQSFIAKNTMRILVWEQWEMTPLYTSEDVSLIIWGINKDLKKVK